VLNSQRQRIYAQRDLIFTKPDLSEDVTELLDTEVNRRVPESLADEEGPWKLLAWLDQIQPPLDLGGMLFPSYSLKLLLDHLASKQKTFTSIEQLRDALLSLAGDALQAEQDHLLHTVDLLLESSRERLEGQVRERLEALDMFFEGLRMGEADDASPRSPRELLDELVGTVHVNVRLTPEEQRLLRDDPDKVKKAVRQQVEGAVLGQSTLRLMGAVERRLEESLELEASQLNTADWNALTGQMSQAVELVLGRRRERLLGNGAGPAAGQLAHDIENHLARINGQVTTNHLLGILLMMPQGTKASFDKKTHKRVLQRTTRLSFVYLSARLLGERQPDEITQDVLKHLQSARQALQRAWGLAEFSRMAQARLPDLDPSLQETLCTLLGEGACASLQTQPMQSLDREQVMLVMDELGRRALTEVYRQLLLGVITELWVEYLTQMEALRVSIGLEAYGQRDPLVQYKSKASALFQNLLKDMRSGVISRMFIYRPRDMSAVQSEVRPVRPVAEVEGEAAEAGDGAGSADERPTGEAEPEAEEDAMELNNPSQPQMTKSQKRRRHRK
jgi:preprotein translocase subunit SecA